MSLGAFYLALAAVFQLAQQAGENSYSADQAEFRQSAMSMAIAASHRKQPLAA
jgi:hypothetical protein